MSRPENKAAAEEQPLKVKKSKKRKRLLLEANAEQSVNGGDNNLTKALGSPDYQTRDKALMVLTEWLTKRPSITDTDLNKIWKGLFYTFWHSDKQPAQEALAERLALILPQLQPKVAFAYWASFMETLRREWFGIDRLRLDKFMMLARKFVQQTFECLRGLNWAAEEVTKFSSQLAEAVLLNGDACPDQGFVFHLSDCWVSELLVFHESNRIPAPALDTLLAPFTLLLAHCGTTSGISRVTRGAFEPLLDACEAGATDSPPADASFLHDLADSIFAAGASEGVRVMNREALYSLSRRLHKAADKAPASLPPHQKQKQQQKPSKQQKQQQKLSKQQKQQKQQKQESPTAALPPALAADQDAQQAPNGTAPRGRLPRFQSTTDAADAAELLPAGNVELAASGIVGAHHANGISGSDDVQDSPSASVMKRQKKKKKKQEVAAALAAVDAELDTLQAGEAAAFLAVKGGSSRSGGIQVVSQQATAQAVKSEAATVVPAAVKVGSQVRLHSKAAAAMAAAEITAAVGSPATPVPVFPALGDAAAASSTRKSVQFRMKKNLYFEHGGPAVAVEVRTPPGTSRFPGSALRAASATATAAVTEPTCRRLHGTLSRSTPSRGGKGKLKSPKSIPRSKASAYF